MGDASHKFVLFGSRLSITLTGALAALFAVRAVMSAQGVSSLSGPAWTVLDALVAAAAVLRCFDRVVVTPRGITIFRLAVPRRFSIEQIRGLQLMPKTAQWSRLMVETIDGKQSTIATERRNAGGQARMQRLLDETHEMLGATLQTLMPQPPAAAAPEQTSVPAAKRRCIRSGCPAYFAEVISRRCESCGSPTQRITS